MHSTGNPSSISNKFIFDNNSCVVNVQIRPHSDTMAGIIVLQTYLQVVWTVGWLFHTIASLQCIYKRLVNIHAGIRNATCSNHNIYFIKHVNMHTYMLYRQYVMMLIIK